jgi:hypothetical protein
MADISSEKMEQSRMIGQRTAIRAFVPNDPEDMERLQKIFQDPDVQRWMEGVKDMNADDIKRFSKRQGRKWGRGYQHEFVFAISGSPGFLRNSDEEGKVQGVVNIYRVFKEDKDALVEKGLFKDDEDIFEVSYARNPQARPGQVSSGLIQACFRLDLMLGNTERGEKPSLPIVAFVESENRNSVSVLEHSGFERIGWLDGDEVYRLNWEKAQSILHESADEEFVATF